MTVHPDDVCCDDVTRGIPRWLVWCYAALFSGVGRGKGVSPDVENPAPST